MIAARGITLHDFISDSTSSSISLFLPAMAKKDEKKKEF
jgi:hypothetical protein